MHERQLKNNEKDENIISRSLFVFCFGKCTFNCVFISIFETIFHSTNFSVHWFATVFFFSSKWKKIFSCSFIEWIKFTRATTLEFICRKSVNEIQFVVGVSVLLFECLTTATMNVTLTILIIVTIICTTRQSVASARRHFFFTFVLFVFHSRNSRCTDKTFSKRAREAKMKKWSE